MDYRSCSVLNDNFVVTEEGKVYCTASKVLISDSLERAYIFMSLFFYDIAQKEVGKLTKKISDRREAIISSSETDPTATDKLFMQLSSMFRQETGGNALDGLIKTELAKIKPHISLKLSPDEDAQLKKMREAIYRMEYEKFRSTMLHVELKPGQEKEITFSPQYIAGLPDRAKRLLKSTVKMVAYTYGMQFDKFELTPEYKLTYTWSNKHHTFNEVEIKNRLKAVIAEKPFA